eukprot:469240-Hanusia_phi.AAC.1
MEWNGSDRSASRESGRGAAGPGARPRSHRHRLSDGPIMAPPGSGLSALSGSGLSDRTVPGRRSWHCSPAAVDY